jgi:hypothetical protein
VDDPNADELSAIQEAEVQETGSNPAVPADPSHVIPVSNLLENLQVGDWVIAQFPLDNGKPGSLKFVAQICEQLTIHNKTNFRLDCLRAKNTKKDPGFIFTFPAVRDNQGIVPVEDIIKKLNPPVPSQRALKFDILLRDI